MEFDTVNPEVVEQNPAVGIGESNDVNAADLFAPEANSASEQPKETQTDAPAPQTDDRRFTSDEMSKAVQNRLKQERKKAAYVLGEEMLKERMRADNIDESEALKRIREDRIKQKAAQFKADPEKGFAELIRQQNTPVEDTRTTEANDVDAVFNAMVGDIQSGKVPNGFDLNAHMSDPNRAREFVDLYKAFGMERACEMSARMYAPAPTQKEINGALPKPINTNNRYTPSTPDVWSMTPEAFAKMEQRMKTARAQGKTVNF
jgi:hypothetical protein